MAEAVTNFEALAFRNRMLKFFEELFQHVLLETERYEYTPRFAHMDMSVPLYRDTFGVAVVRILQISRSHIDEFYGSISERLQNSRNVRKLLSGLGTRFLLSGRAQDTLYFLSVASRFFALMDKTDVQSTETYIKECVIAVAAAYSGEDDPYSAFGDMVPLVWSIFDDLDNWQDHFESLNCGDADFYFPAEAEAAENI